MIKNDFNFKLSKSKKELICIAFELIDIVTIRKSLWWK